MHFVFVLVWTRSAAISPQTSTPLLFALSMDRKALINFLVEHDEVDINVRNVRPRGSQ
jgi:hypothetical protein